MGILAAKLNLVVQAGATWTEQFLYADINENPIDITSWSARMEIRSSVNSETVIYTLLDSAASPLPRLILGGAAGTINLVIEAVDTTPLAVNNSATTLVYGLELYKDDGGVEKVISLLSGTIAVSPEVVRG